MTIDFLLEDLPLLSTKVSYFVVACSATLQSKLNKSSFPVLDNLPQ